MTQPPVAQKRLELSDIYSNSNLTRLQVLYWVAQQLRPTSPFLNTILTFTIDGAVDCEHFETAFQTLVGESDALRTVIDGVDGVPQGRILPTAEVELQHLDFAGQADPEAAARGWIQEQSVVPLDLSERLFHAALIKTSTDRFIWYFNQHHMIADASSFFLVFERMAELYERSRQGTIVEAAPLTPFQQYVKYERAYRDSAHYLNAKAYWQSKLEPGPEPLRFLGQAPVKKTTRVERVTFDLGAARSKKLRDVAQQQDIFAISEELTLYSLLATLFFVLLHHMSGNRRIGFVTPVHNRFNTAFRNAIGLVMEICPLQVEISKDDSFISLLKKVQSEVRETMAHYQYASGMTLNNKAFDVMFNVYPSPALSLDSMMVKSERIHPGHGSESLALHVNDDRGSGRLILYFDFHRDLFSSAASQHVVEACVRFLDEFLVDRSRSINAARLLTPTFDDHNSKGFEVSGTVPDTCVVQRVRKIVTPRDLLERQLIQIWEEILEVQPLSIKDNFFDAGGSSWLAVRLFSRIREGIGVNLPLTMLLEAGTVEELAIRVRNYANSSSFSPLVKIQEGDGGLPFFCVHGAGGHVLLFGRLAHYLGSNQAFYAFKARGVDGEVEPNTSVEQMAAEYLQALQEIQPQGPYLLGGYSFGGIVAFEMAQQLREKGEQVALLAIIDVPAQNPYLSYVRKLTRFGGRLLRMDAEQQLQLYLTLYNYIFRVRYIMRLDHSQRLAYIFRKRGGVEEKTGQSTSKDGALPNNGPDTNWQSESFENRRIQKIWALNSLAFKEYIPNAYPYSLTLFRSTNGYSDPDLDYSPDPYLGWGRIVRGHIETHLVPGNHNEMIREPNVQILAKQLRGSIDRAYTNSSVTQSMMRGEDAL